MFPDRKKSHQSSYFLSGANGFVSRALRIAASPLTARVYRLRMPLLVTFKREMGDDLKKRKWRFREQAPFFYKEEETNNSWNVAYRHLRILDDVA